jgi:hypothetical protein
MRADGKPGIVRSKGLDTFMAVVCLRLSSACVFGVLVFLPVHVRRRKTHFRSATISELFSIRLRLCC